jgi:hypothetical protein
MIAAGDGDAVWLVELGAIAPPSESSGPAPFGIVAPGMAPMAAPDRPSGGTGSSAAAQQVVRVSDRGWIGESGDALAANVPFPPRLAEPVAIERALPVYPDQPRRLAVSVGELLLLNADGRLDELAGDWSTAGRTVTLRRGPHRRPQHASLNTFSTIATFTAGAAASGTQRLSVPLRSAASDLAGPACNVYSGVGGPEGPATLAGRNKPRLFGTKKNIEPVLVDPALLIYQISDGALTGTVFVRDRGVLLDFPRSYDVATYDALVAANVSASAFVTCRALGLVRVAATPSLLTCDATASGGTSAADIAAALLNGPGGQTGVSGSGFAWRAGVCGLYLTGGTVAEAMDALAAGVFGWWGTDASGAFLGGTLTAPESAAGSPFAIEPWMLAAPPEEIGPPRVPWWRVRCGYQLLGRTQSGEELAGVVTAANREYYGRPWRTATAWAPGVLDQYPLAEDGPELVTPFDAESDAQALANSLLSAFGTPRRMFEAPIRPNAGGWLWPTMDPGDLVTLRWPGVKALATARRMIVTNVSARGDAVTLTLWG